MVEKGNIYIAVAAIVSIANLFLQKYGLVIGDETINAIVLVITLIVAIVGVILNNFKKKDTTK